MDHIILKGDKKEGFVFSISELMIGLQRLTDSRKARGKRYKLSHILIWGFLPGPSKRFNPEFLTNPTSGRNSYNWAKSSNFQILI